MIAWTFRTTATMTGTMTTWSATVILTMVDTWTATARTTPVGEDVVFVGWGDLVLGRRGKVLRG